MAVPLDLLLSSCCDAELAEVEKADCKSKGICCFNWEGLGAGEDHNILSHGVAEIHPFLLAMC